MSDFYFYGPQADAYRFAPGCDCPEPTPAPASDDPVAGLRSAAQPLTIAQTIDAGSGFAQQVQDASADLTVVP